MTTPSPVRHAAIVRSPHAHARILGYDTTAALAMPGVVGVVTGADVADRTKPFGVGVTDAGPLLLRRHRQGPLRGRAGGGGGGARSVHGRGCRRARGQVQYEPLPAVVDPERALEPDAPVLHEAVGTNLAAHRRFVYGDPDQAFRDADVVIRERFRFPKYGSTPIETYAIVARWNPFDGRS